MKKTILFILFLTIPYKIFADNSYLKQCIELKDYVSNADNYYDIENDHNSTIKHVMNLLKKIVNIKFEMTSYLQDNKEIYGKYKSLDTQKIDLENEILALTKERAETLEHYKQEVASIDPDLTGWHYSRVYKRIMKQKKRDLKRIDDIIKSKHKEKDKMMDDFLDALAEWSPYKEYLTQLEKLEESLLKSLDTLSKIVALKHPEAEDIKKDIAEFKSTHNTKQCEKILRDLIIIHEKIPHLH